MSENRTSFFTQKEQTLYHITDRAKLNVILVEGLHPDIGANSLICAEDEKMVYLADLDSIPYWVILLAIKEPVLLEVKGISAEKFQYSCYAEYITYDIITPEHISLADQSLLNDVTIKHMQALCKSYVISLSISCLWIIRGYTYGTIDDIPFESILAFLSAIERLDYSCCSLSEWHDVVREYGESGEYTFCDHYSYKERSGPKLFEQIVLFPEDKYLPIRKRLHDIIQQLFPGCEEWETGGWTG